MTYILSEKEFFLYDGWGAGHVGGSLGEDVNRTELIQISMRSFPPFASFSPSGAAQYNVTENIVPSKALNSPRAIFLRCGKRTLCFFPLFVELVTSGRRCYVIQEVKASVSGM